MLLEDARDRKIIIGHYSFQEPGKWRCSSTFYSLRLRVIGRPFYVVEADVCSADARCLFLHWTTSLISETTTVISDICRMGGSVECRSYFLRKGTSPVFTGRKQYLTAAGSSNLFFTSRTHDTMFNRIRYSLAGVNRTRTGDHYVRTCPNSCTCIYVWF